MGFHNTIRRAEMSGPLLIDGGKQGCEVPFKTLALPTEFVEEHYSPLLSLGMHYLKIMMEIKSFNLPDRAWGSCGKSMPAASS